MFRKLNALALFSVPLLLGAQIDRYHFVEPRIATALPHQFHDYAALALHLDDLVPTVVVDLGAPLDSSSKREALSSVQVFGGPPESNT